MSSTTISQSQLSTVNKTLNENPDNPAVTWGVLQAFGDQYASIAYQGLTNPDSKLGMTIHISNYLAGVTPAQEGALKQAIVAGYVEMLNKATLDINGNIPLPKTADIDNNYFNSATLVNVSPKAAVDLSFSAIVNDNSIFGWPSAVSLVSQGIDAERISDGTGKQTGISIFGAFMHLGALLDQESINIAATLFGTSLNVDENARARVVRELASSEPALSTLPTLSSLPTVDRGLLAFGISGPALSDPSLDGQNNYGFSLTSAGNDRNELSKLSHLTIAAADSALDKMKTQSADPNSYRIAGGFSFNFDNAADDSHQSTTKSYDVTNANGTVKGTSDGDQSTDPTDGGHGGKYDPNDPGNNPSPDNDPDPLIFSLNRGRISLAASGGVGAATGILALMTNGGPQILGPNLVPGAADALAALATFDSNQDGKIDAGDAVFGSLRVLDGIGNSLTLSDLGIAAIRLGRTAMSVDAQGNSISAVATLVFTDGTIGPVENVTFGAGAVTQDPAVVARAALWSDIAARRASVFGSAPVLTGMPDGNAAATASSDTGPAAQQLFAAVAARINTSQSGNGVNVYSNSSATINGQGTAVALNSDDVITINGGGFAVSLNGNGSTLTANGDGDEISVWGSGNHLTVNGSGERIVLRNSGNVVTTALGTVLVANGTSAVVNGASNTLGLGSSDQVQANGGSFAIAVEGSRSVLTANGNGDHILVIGDNDVVTANGSQDAVVIDGLNDALSLGSGSAVVADGSSATVNGQNSTLWLGSRDAVQVNGQGFSIALNGSSSGLTASGDGNTVTLQGQGNAVTMNGAHAVISASGDSEQLTINGGDATIFVTGNATTVAANGTEDTVFLQGGNDTAALTGGTVFLADRTNATINGGGNTVVLGNSDNVTVNGSGSAVIVNGSGSAVTINGDAARFKVTGDGETIQANGQGDFVDVSGLGETVSIGQGRVIVEDASQAMINGAASHIQIGNADAVQVAGSNFTVLAVGDASILGTDGDSNTAVVQGTDNTLTMNGAGSLIMLKGSDNMITANGAGATILIQGSENVVAANGDGDAVLLSGSGNALKIARGTVAVADGSGAIVNGLSDAVALGSRDAVTIKGNQFVITDTGDSSTLTTNGDGESTSIDGNQDSVTANGGQGSVSVLGNNDSVTANGNGNAVTVSGQGNVVFANGSGDQVSLAGTGNDVHTSGNVVTVQDSSQAWINGGGDTVNLGNADNASVNGSGHTIDVNGQGSTLAVVGDWNTVAITGHGDTTTIIGNSDSVTLAGTGHSLDVIGTLGRMTVSGTGDHLQMESGVVTLTHNAQAVLDGHGNIVTLGDGASLGVGGGSNWVNAVATDTVSLSGSKNGVGFSGNGGNVAVDGSGHYVTMTGGTLTLAGGSDARLTGDGNNATVGTYGTLEVNGSANSIAMNGGSLVLDDLVGTRTGSNPSGFAVRGFGYTSEQNGQFGSTAGAQSLHDLATTGANAVQIVTTQYLADATSTTIAPTNATESDANLEQAIGQAKADGLSVMLKPHIDPLDGTWRAMLQPSSTDQFFANYKSFILHYAAIAQATYVDSLSVGCELESLSGAAYRSQWTDIIAAVRQVYSGTLTYSSAWNETGKVSFWDKVDVIGANAYEAPTLQADPTVAQMVTGWNSVSSDAGEAAAFNNKSPVDFYHDLSTTYGKPVVFTETGYRSVNATNTLNGDWSGFHYVDFQQQAKATEALFEAWSPHSTWMQGTYLWNWDADPKNVSAQDFSVQGKPAIDAVEAWYGGTSSTTAMPGHNTLAGAGNIVTLGKGDGLDVTGNTNQLTLSGQDAVTITGTGNQIAVGGTGNLIAANNATSIVLGSDGAAAIVRGNATTIALNGSGDAVALGGDNASIAMNGDRGTVTVAGDNASLTATGNNVTMSTSGQNNTVSLLGTGALVLASGGATIHVGGQGVAASIQGDGAQVLIDASNTSIALGGSADAIKVSAGGSTTLALSDLKEDDVITLWSNSRSDQLWFAQSGNDLDVSRIGTNDQVVLKDWYTDPSHQAQSFVASDGHVLPHDQVATMVNAMASLALPPSGQTSLTADLANKLQPTMSSAWH